MKRTTNVQMWPYIGPTVMNELGKTTVVCESLMLEERHEAYVFVLNSMFEMDPTVDRSRAMQFQCVHELVIHMKFIPDYFGKRWVKRKTLTKSKRKGNYINPRCYKAISDGMVSCYMNEKGYTEPTSDMNKVRGVMVEEVVDGSVVLQEDHAVMTDNGIHVNANVLHQEVIFNNDMESDTLSHVDFMAISSKLFNACQRNKEYKCLVGGMMLQMLETVNEGHLTGIDHQDPSLTTTHFSELISS